MAFQDPRSCTRDFLQTGRNLGKRLPSFSLRNLQRDARSIVTRVENIGERVEGAIGAAARGDFLPGQLLSITNEFRCPPTPYANYFSQHRPPKFKFMFFVTFYLNPDFKAAFGEPWPEAMHWYIKQSGRPNVAYEYEEVNMYNFRQKVLRRATLNPVTVSIYDDLEDTSAGFWNTFLRLQSPVTTLNSNFSRLIEESGMNWGRNEDLKKDPRQIRSTLGPLEDQPYLKYSASTGVLPGQNGFKQILEKIEVFHLMDWGQRYVAYEYVNPRIMEINLDELTWEDSTPNTIEVQFEYDTFQIHFPQGVSEEFITRHMTELYPISPNLGETPFESLNKGIDKLNTGIQSGIQKAKDVASNIPGLTNLRQG